jgi:hypothetical protein
MRLVGKGTNLDCIKWGSSGGTPYFDKPSPPLQTPHRRTRATQILDEINIELANMENTIKGKIHNLSKNQIEAEFK